MRHGSLLKTASIRFPSNVLISQRLSQIIASLTRENLEAREAEVTTQTSLGRKQKKTVLWPDAEVDNVPGVTRNLCCLSVHLQMKRAIH